MSEIKGYSWHPLCVAIHYFDDKEIRISVPTYAEPSSSSNQYRQNTLHPLPSISTTQQRAAVKSSLEEDYWKKTSNVTNLCSVDRLLSWDVQRLIPRYDAMIDDGPWQVPNLSVQ